MTTAEQIISQLLDRNSPVAARMRSIFSLKGLATPQAVQALEKSLVTDPSALVRHEVAYVLGQMRAIQSLPTLTKVLENAAEDVMVRHEAAEAMGAIAHNSVLPLLDRYAADASLAREIRETCVLAVNRIRWYQHQTTPAQAPYTSVDPAPPEQGKDVSQLQDLLCDASKPIFERYKAMFALRNIGGEQAVLALCAGMDAEKESALFRHEVAYVLGQMQHSASVPTLARFLKDQQEHEMVRHEAAEALGSIASPQAEKILDQFRADEKDVVRESVEVALDISDYISGDHLHYAQKINGASNTTSLQATR
ncbi:Deoxyhypusine hydroxylase [Gracilariopsis chorda]|uniref:Deoxyhypusine hydroxylase n=1 Tax=Gracilariopsis chorda TaxID=448386 RepID=A0A2V3J706_9FLOR|nr:Deoxyhypusine hydroxylase [Gracilariopsis chorda]|eukprot:PXF50154.1 Deoxyhypusine hydroxylase [Gracilariopsis chorda]